eukprot:gene22166-biopygen2712
MMLTGGGGSSRPHLSWASGFSSARHQATPETPVDPGGIFRRSARPHQTRRTTPGAFLPAQRLTPSCARPL